MEPINNTSNYSYKIYQPRIIHHLKSRTTIKHLNIVSFNYSINDYISINNFSDNYITI